MAIIGKTFDAQLVSAGDDGALYRMLAGKRDMLSTIAGGNPFTISNNVLSIAQSYLLICGRFMRIAGGTTISLGTIPSNHVRGRVIVTLDMTKLASESTLSQIITEVETITSGGSFRSLTTNQDINSITGQTSSKYEAVLCTFTCSSGTASSPVNALSSALSYPLAIANGGTGATTSANARTNLEVMPLYDYTDADGGLNITTVSEIYTRYAQRCSVNAVLGTSRYWFDIFYSSANYGLVVAYHSVNPPLSKVFALRNGSWADMGTIFDTGCIRINYTSEALTGLSAKQIKVASSETMSGMSFGTATAGNTYITLPAGEYRMHTHFACSPSANGYVKSCLKIGQTSTTFIMTDKFLAGGSSGSSATIIGINATDRITLTAQTNIYFLVMSSGSVEGFNATLTIERLE